MCKDMHYNTVQISLQKEKLETASVGKRYLMVCSHKKPVQGNLEMEQTVQ